MATTPPDDIAAMFDLAPEAAESTTQSVEAAEAALAAELAAELASTIESGGAADDAPDSRTRLRVAVAWPARMQLPDGHVIDLKVRNISEGGVGLTSDEHIPARTVVNFEMDVSPLAEGGEITLVKGVIKTTYTVAHGAELLCGGTWQAPPAGSELVNMWIRRLRL
jgi:hypothetical protein